MAHKLVWTPLARQDLHDVVSYIARDKPDAARRVGERILGCVEMLASNPRLGHPVPERSDELIREIIRGNYRIIYRVDESSESVQIWRIWHGARGEPSLDEMG